MATQLGDDRKPVKSIDIPEVKPGTQLWNLLRTLVVPNHPEYLARKEKRKGAVSK
jgi:hypothetical protein